MNNCTIYCTETLTKRALKLGAPISTHWSIMTNNWIYDNPTTEQMVGWLIKHGILPVIDMANSASFECGFASMIKMENNIKQFIGVYPTPKEAIFAAISAALEYLEKLKP